MYVREGVPEAQNWAYFGPVLNYQTVLMTGQSAGEINGIVKLMRRGMEVFIVRQNGLARILLIFIFINSRTNFIRIWQGKELVCRIQKRALEFAKR